MPDLSVRGKLSLDGSQWDATMRNAGEQVTAFGESISRLKEQILAAFSVEAIKTMITDSLELGESITNISERLGISKQAVQDFGFAFKQAGLDSSLLVTIFDRLATSMENALGSGEAAQQIRESFEALGVTFQDLQSDNVELVFRRIMEHLASSAKSAKEIAELRQVGGRGASALIPAAGEFNAKVAEGGRFALSDSDIEALHKGSQHLGEFKAAVTKLGAMSAVGLGQLFSQEGRDNIERGYDRILHHPIDSLHSLHPAAAASVIANTLSPNVGDTLPGFSGDSSVVGTLSNKSSGKFSDLPTQRETRLRGHEDSLLRIGNFLGSNAGAINSIGQETNKILRAIHQTLKDNHQHPQQPGLTSSRGVPS